MSLDPAIRLRHLVSFCEVAEARSVVKAAARLGVTQPAVSKTIRELETILGVELFDRTRRSVALSRFGEIFLRHAKAGLAAFRQGVDSLAEARSPSATPVRIGALPTVSARLMPDAVRRFMRHRLGASPRIVTGPTDYLTAQLREGGLDIVIGRMAEPLQMKALAFEPLYSEPLCFCARPGHPLLQETVCEPRRIGEFEVLMPPPGSVIRPAVDRLLLASGIPRPAITVETVSLAFGRAYVRSTDAIWIISEGVVAQDLSDETLAALPVDISQSVGSVGITTLVGTRLSPATEIFVQELRFSAGALAGARQDQKGNPT